MLSRLMEKLDRMGRRRFLNTLGKFGVSATSLNYLTQDSVGQVVDDLEEEVPYVEFLRHTNHEKIGPGTIPKREPVWDTIPREKWVRVRSAHNAAQSLNERLTRKFGSPWISAAVTSRNGDSYQKEIVVKYTELEHANGEVSAPSVAFSKVEDALPNSVSGQVKDGKNTRVIEGIPVRIEQFEIVESVSCPGDVYATEYDKIPGGCATEGGTCCTPAVDSSGSEAMIHCAHLNETYLSQPDESTSGADLKLNNSISSGSNDMADYRPNFPDKDTGFLQWRLADDDGTVKAPEIYGIVSWETLQNKEGTDYTLKQQGNTTGTESGTITNTVVKSSGAKNVWTNCHSAGGDSGGPVYREFYNSQLNRYEAYIAYINSWHSSNSDGQCPGDDSGGNALEYVENKLQLTV